MQKIREILLNEYIGAIAIGMLLVQAAGSAITVVTRAIGFYLEKGSRPQGVFGGAEGAFPRVAVIGSVVNLVLYVLVIYLLLYWLYLRQAPPDRPADEAEEGGQQA